MEEIPKNAGNVEDYDQDLPLSITTMDDTKQDLENKLYVISFKNYHKDYCELDLLQSKDMKMALQAIKFIGTEVSQSKHLYYDQKFRVKRIIENVPNQYSRLYDRVDEGIELCEIILKDTGRIFFYELPVDRVIHIIAITNRHFETDKIRR